MNAYDRKITIGAHEDRCVRSVEFHTRTNESHDFIVKQPDPRIIAALVIERILVTSASAATALPGIFRQFRQIDARHRSFATELVYTTLRMRRNVEAQLSAHATRVLPQDTSLQAHLLVATAEILYLGRVQASGPTAIDVAVAQVEALRGPRIAGIANSVLSRILASRTRPS